MKFILVIYIILSTTYLSFSQTNLDSLIQGDWKILDSKYNICTEFSNGKASRRNCDSLSPKSSNIFPYKIDGEFIEVIAHPLEQVHYKIIEIKGDTLIVDMYFPKVKKKDMLNGTPIKKRKRKFHSREIWIRNQ